MAYHPGDERESRTVITCTSEGDDLERSPLSGRQQGLTTHRPTGARVRAWCHSSQDPTAGRDREPACEPHDSTGEPRCRRSNRSCLP